MARLYANATGYINQNNSVTSNGTYNYLTIEEQTSPFKIFEDSTWKILIPYIYEEDWKPLTTKVFDNL